MARSKTQTEMAMTARLHSLDPKTPRYALLAAARDFKASWLDLGERLMMAREKETYAEWGFVSFEAYCRRELQIKQDTANKLTRSFAYLREHEPTILQDRTGRRDLPALDVVDLLSQAQARTQIDADAFATIREQVMAPQAQLTRAEIMKKVREVDPEALRPPAKAKEALAPGPHDLRKALLLAERLESLLTAQHGDVFLAAAQKAAAVVVELRARFAVLEQQVKVAPEGDRTAPIGSMSAPVSPGHQTADAAAP